MQIMTQAGASVEIKQAIELLENWAGWMRGSAGGAGGYVSSMYMSPDERAQAGGVCRAARWNEGGAERVNRVLAVMRNSGRQVFVRLLEKHYQYRANPRFTCRRERLPLADYDEHLERAVRVFAAEYVIWELTPVDQIIKNALNNLIPAPCRGQNPSRVISLARRV